MGILQMLASTTGGADGLAATLRAAQGLLDLKNTYEELGGQMTINLDQGEKPRVLEGAIGECNNGDENYHELVAYPTRTANIPRHFFFVCARPSVGGMG